MRINCKKTILAGAIAASLAASTQAGLIHRYSFTSDGSDSVGGPAYAATGLNGVVFGDVLPSATNASLLGVSLYNVTTGTTLRASSDTNGQYLTIPTNAVVGLKSITLESWTDLGSAALGIPPGQRIADFGDPLSAPGNGRNYIAVVPNSGGHYDAEFSLNQVTVQIGAGTPTLVGYHHVVLSIDCTNGYADLYVDGLNQGHVSTAYQLTNCVFKELRLGRSEWSGDFYLDGVIDEFRIYDRPLSGVEVAADYLAGSDNFSVNTVTNLSNLQAVNIVVPTNIVSLDGSNNILEHASVTLSPTADFKGPLGGGTNDAGVAVFKGLSLFSAPGFTLTSSDPTTASVTSAGVVKGLKPGQVTITATYNSVSSNIKLNVLADTNAPTIVSVANKGYDRLLLVTFSKPVTPATANVAANYSIDGGVSVLSASLSADGLTATLHTTQFGVNDVHTLTVNNIQDTDFTPNTMTGVTGSVGPGAPLTLEVWPLTDGGAKIDYASAGAANTMTALAGYPYTGVTTYSLANGLSFGNIQSGNYYAVTSGWLWPTNTGVYTFGQEADDYGQLFISSDDTEAHLPSVANIAANGWAAATAFADNGPGGTSVRKINGVVATVSPWVASVSMTAGQRYFFRTMTAQTGGGANYGVAWADPTGTIVNGMAAIPAKFIQPYVQPARALTITSEPSSLLVAQGLDAVFTVAVDSLPKWTGTQWYKISTNNITSAIVSATNNLTYTDPIVTTNNSGEKFFVVVSNLVDTVTSSIVSLTVNNDTTKPQVVSAIADLTVGATNITVAFSKRMASNNTATSISAKANFTITGLTVTAVRFDPVTLTNVIVTVSTPLVASNAYTLTVKNVKDLSGNVIDAAHNVIVFHAPQWASPGAFTINYYDTYNSGVDNIIATAPTLTPRKVTYANMDTVLIANNGDANNDVFGAVAEGLIQAPESGDYTFYAETDDGSRFFLSTDDTPANLSATAICGVTGWCQNRNGFSATVDVNGGANLLSAPQTLVAGQRYYYRIAWVDTGGGNFCQIGWSTPSIPALHTVPGSALVSPASIDWSSVSITTNPVSQVTSEGKTVTFSASAVGSSQYGTAVGYQWYKNGTAIAGATSPTYTLPIPGPLFADSGSTFQVVASVPLKAATSTVATLTVNRAPTATVVSAGSVGGSQTVGVRFSELVDPVTATDVSHYSIPGVVVTGVTFGTNAMFDGINGDNVVLAIDTQVLDETLQLTVSGVQSFYGAAIPTSTVPINLSLLTPVDIGAPTFAGIVQPTGSNSFRIQAGGGDIWNAGDQFTFAYEQVTGDFDIRARVANIARSDNWAKSGVVVRETLDTNSVMFYFITTAPTGQNVWSSGERPDNTAACDNPPHPAGITNDIPNPSFPNAWVRITRLGNQLAAWYSTDGLAWVKQATNRPAATSPALGSTMYVGIGVTAHNNGAGYYTTSDIYDYSKTGYSEEVSPTITATTTPAGVVLSWPSAASPGFSVFSSATVDGTFNDSGLTVTDNGTTASVLVQPTGSKMFYELKK